MLPNQPPEEATPGQSGRLLQFLKNPLTSLTLAMLLLMVDFFSGPGIQLAITFVFPVAICAWFSSTRWAYFLAIFQSVVRLGFVLTWDTPWGLQAVLITAAIRVIVLCIIGWFVSRAAAQSRELARKAKILSGSLPICLHCKRIHDAKDTWEEVELYVARHSEATFEHCLCSDCATKQYGDILGKA